MLHSCPASKMAASNGIIGRSTSLVRHRISLSLARHPTSPYRSLALAAQNSEPAPAACTTSWRVSSAHRRRAACLVVSRPRHPPGYTLISREGQLVEEKEKYISHFIAGIEVTCSSPRRNCRPRRGKLLPHDLSSLQAVSGSCRRTPSPCASYPSTPVSRHPVPSCAHPIPIPPSPGTRLSPVPVERTWLLLSSSTPALSSPSPPPSPLDKPSPAQLAFVFLKLREEIPVFFDGHHSMSMYASDVQLEHSLGWCSCRIRGSTLHGTYLSACRVSLRMCFSQTRLDLLKITKEMKEGKIEARWRVRGSLRIPWVGKERIIVEAFSTFTVNSDGLISVHKIDRMMPGKKERSRLVGWLAQVGVALRLTPPQPTPSIVEPGPT